MRSTKRKDLLFESLCGVTLKRIVVHVIDKDEDAGDFIEFVTREGKRYAMHHSQSCCESVSIDSIVGDLQDLIGTPITLAEAATNAERTTRKSGDHNQSEKSHTWTFYKLATIKGYVDIRWYGKSNGFYAEDVSFSTLDPDISLPTGRKSFE